MAADKVDWPWDVLGLDAPAEDARAVRRAYAVRLKALAAEDVAAFQNLRHAYDTALEICGTSRAPRSVVAQALGDGLPPPPARHRSRRPVAGADAMPAGMPPGDATPPAPAAEGNPAAAQGFWGPRSGHDETDVAQGPGHGPDGAETARRAALRNKVTALLGDQNFVTGNWQSVFSGPSLEDNAFAREIEGMIVWHIERVMAQQQAPAGLPADWLNAADRVFGWRADGVGFRRRHPYADRAYATLILSGVEPAQSAPEKSNFGLFFTLFFVTAGGVIAILSRVTQSDAPALAAFSLLMTFLIMGFGLLLWNTVLSWVPELLSRIFPALNDLRMRARLWLMRRVGPVTRKAVMLAVATAALWVFLMVSVFDVTKSQRPSISVVQVSSRIFADPAMRYAGIAPSVNDTAVLPPDWQPILRYPVMTRPADMPPGVPQFAVTCPQPSRTDAPGKCRLLLHAPDTLARVIRVRSDTGVEELWFQVVKGHSFRVETDGNTDQFDRKPTFSVLPFDESPSAFPGMTGRAPLFPAVTDVDKAALASEPPLNLRVPWQSGPIVLDFWHCKPMQAAGDSAVARDCAIDESDILGRHQINCGPAVDAMSCMFRLTEQMAQAQAEAADAAPLVVSLGGEALAVMGQLMDRSAMPGQHPPLPQSAVVDAIRDAVLRDYALILDQPAAATLRVNRLDIEAALARQPQLFAAYTAKPEQQAAIWVAMLAQMARLGFDVQPAAP